MNDQKPKKLKLDFLLPRAKVDSSIFACSSDSFSEIWNSTRGEGSPHLIPNSFSDRSHSIRIDTQQFTRGLTVKKETPIIIPDNKVYRGVNKESDYLDKILRKLKSNAIEDNLKNSKAKKPENLNKVNLSIETRKVCPAEGLIIKSLQSSPISAYFKDSSMSSRLLQVFPEEPRFMYKLPNLGNKVELKVNKKKIEFSSKKVVSPSSPKQKKKPVNSKSFSNLKKNSLKSNSLYSQGKSPLSVNSFSIKTQSLYNN